MKKFLGIFFGYLMIAGSNLLAISTPKQVIVGPDDTVYGIAYENGISSRTLISANNLSAPYTLVVGQVLLVPAAGEHIVGSAENLQTIAEAYGVNVDVLAQENRIQSPYFVKPGEILAIPSHDTESFTEALGRPSTPEIVTSSLEPLPLVKTASPSERPGASPKIIHPPQDGLPDDLAEEIAREKGAPKKETSKPMLMGNLAQGNAGAPLGEDAVLEDEPEDKPVQQKPKKEIKKVEKKEPEKPKGHAFIWPIEGEAEVISKFSGDGKNDGINIQIPEGTPVKASAAGEVMYAGDELKSFGKLLLVKHKDGWVTAYAHLSEFLVKKGDTVKQGQVIAKSGKTGDVNEPQLHFEIRKKKQAVDPLDKLAHKGK